MTEISSHFINGESLLDLQNPKTFTRVNERLKILSILRIQCLFQTQYEKLVALIAIFWEN